MIWNRVEHPSQKTIAYKTAASLITMVIVGTIGVSITYLRSFVL